MNTIQANDLTMDYRIRGGLHQALRGVSFEVGSGECVAVLGPNGAGKSTLFKILSGILIPTRGEVRALGFRPWDERMAYTRNIGVVMGQKSLLFWDIPVIESLRLFKEIYGLGDSEFKSNLARLSGIFGVAELLDRPVRKLSLGQRMKCEIIASVLHLPRLLILDEPTIGLDLPTKLSLLSYLRDLRRETGATVLLATHSLQEVEFLCERILILSQGRFIFDGSPAQLKSRIDERRVAFRVARIADGPAFERLRSAMGLRLEGPMAAGRVRASQVTSLLRDAFACADIEDISVEEPTIEAAIQEYFT